MSRRGRYDNGNYAAPWCDHGAEYGPRSPRTGRMVAQTTAQLEYGQDLDSVPVMSEGQVGGFWDFEQEHAMGPRRGAQPAAERHDAAPMAEFFVRFGNALTPREWEIYKLFWEGRLSYAVIARRINARRERVHEAVKRLRSKLKLWSVR